MEVQHFAALFAGILCPPFLAAAAAGIAQGARSRRFRIFKARSVAPDALLPGLPELTRGPDEQQLDRTLYEIIQAHHNRAKAFQDSAFRYLIAGSTGLLVAFAVAAAAVTILSRSESWHIFSAGADVSGLILVGWAFRRARAVRAQWIRQRCLVELLRHWVALEPLTNGAVQGITDRFDAFEARARAALDLPFDELPSAVADFADHRAAEVEGEIVSKELLSAEDVHHYLARRAIRQMRWFVTSEARIVHQQEQRRRLMLALFVAALLSALVKLAGVLGSGTHSAHAVMTAATFALLITIGIATAVTSTFVGQGLRSMRHRYRMQIFTLHTWFERNQWMTQLAPARAPVAARTDIAAAIAQFERHMLVELLDWISIADHDAMELGPI